ncbi:MAG: alpha/beta fold hydrolase [Myxococcota bacterium]
MREDRRIDLGGHALFGRIEGAGRREFLCLHGLVDTLEIWDRMAPALAQRGRVTRIDQRGHGRSDAPPGPYSREALARDVIGVLDGLGIERAILVGHSMGGIVAMTTALAHPRRIEGLVLIGTASHCNERTARWYERIALAGERDGTDGLARAIYGERSRKSIEGDARGIAHVTRTLKSLYDDPLTPALAHLACPALLVVGEKDPMGPRASESILEAMPPGRGTLKVIPSCGHWVHVEAPDVILEALDRGLEGGGSPA